MKKTTTLLLAGLFALAVGAVFAVNAQGYLHSSSGNSVKTSSGDCVMAGTRKPC